MDSSVPGRGFDRAASFPAAQTDESASLHLAACEDIGPQLATCQDIAPLLQTGLLECYRDSLMARAKAMRCIINKNELMTSLLSSAPGVIASVYQKLFVLENQGLLEQAIIVLSRLLSCLDPDIRTAALKAVGGLYRRPVEWSLELQCKLGPALVAVALSDCQMGDQPWVEQVVLLYFYMHARWTPDGCTMFTASLSPLLHVASRGPRKLQEMIFAGASNYTRQCTEMITDMERPKVLLMLMKALNGSVSRTAEWVLPFIACMLGKCAVKTDHIVDQSFLVKFAVVLLQLPVSHAEHVVAIVRAIFDCPRATIERALAARIPVVLVQYFGEQVQEQEEIMGHVASKILLHLPETGRVYLEKNFLLSYALTATLQVEETRVLSASDDGFIEGLETSLELIGAKVESLTNSFGAAEYARLEVGLGELEDRLLVGTCAELELCIRHPSSKEARIRGLEGVRGLCELGPEIGGKLYERGLLAAILQPFGPDAACTDVAAGCARVCAFDAIAGCVGREAIFRGPYSRQFLLFSLSLLETAGSHLVLVPLLANICRIVGSEAGRRSMPAEALFKGLWGLLGHSDPTVRMLALWCAGNIAALEMRLFGRCITAESLQVVKAMLMEDEFRKHGLTLFAAMASEDTEKIQLVLDSGLVQMVLAELTGSRLGLDGLRIILIGLGRLTRGDVATPERLRLLCEMGLESCALSVLRAGRHLGLVLCVINNMLAHAPTYEHFKSDERIIKAMLLTEGFREHGLILFTAMASGGMGTVQLVFEAGLAQVVLAELCSRQLSWAELRVLLVGLSHLTYGEVATAERLLLLCEMGLESGLLAVLRRDQHHELVLCIIHNMLSRVLPCNQHFRSNALVRQLRFISSQFPLAQDILNSHLGGWGA